MAQMAAELGLSPGAVSSVLNGRAKQARISESTVQRVREHLTQRGYVPSRHACHLREAPARVIGILYVGELLSSHLVEGFHKLVGLLGNDTQGLEICMTPLGPVEAAVRDLLARRVTDLVWVNNNSQGGEQYRWGSISQYLRNTRTIIYNYPFDSPFGEKELLDRGVALVGVDRTAQNRRLAIFLKQLGHSVIALPDIPDGELYKNYFETFASVGLKVAVCPPSFTAEGMLKVMKDQGVTAACFHGDNPASMAIWRLREVGVRVPEDLTVMGFDGMSKSYYPDLTTQAIPVGKMVAKVGELIAGTERELSHCFDLELVEGRTHGTPRGENLSLTT